MRDIDDPANVDACNAHVRGVGHAIRITEHRVYRVLRGERGRLADVDREEFQDHRTEGREDGNDDGVLDRARPLHLPLPPTEYAAHAFCDVGGE